MAKAAEFALRQSLLPTLDAPFRFDRPVIGGTHFALKRDGKRENRRLDVQVVYPVLVGDIPLIGGGGDFTLTDQRPIGRSGCTKSNSTATGCRPGWTGGRSGC